MRIGHFIFSLLITVSEEGERKMDSYMKAVELKVMWWPINQECIGCKFKVGCSKEEMKEMLIPEDEKNIDSELEPLAYHASKCSKGIVLGGLGTGSYECPEREEEKEKE